MDKTKTKKTVTKKNRAKETKLKQYTIKKVDALSWVMGKKLYSSREELYDR
jgi:hypothetical protein